MGVKNMFTHGRQISKKDFNIVITTHNRDLEGMILNLIKATENTPDTLIVTHEGNPKNSEIKEYCKRFSFINYTISNEIYHT